MLALSLQGSLLTLNPVIVTMMESISFFSLIQPGSIMKGGAKDDPLWGTPLQYGCSPRGLSGPVSAYSVACLLSIRFCTSHGRR